MNNANGQKRSAKPITLTVLILAVAAAMLCGCVVTSVYPYYTKKDLVFDPAVAGEWTKVDEPGERWSFANEGTNGYRLACSSGNKTNLMQAHLFKLGGERFLDLFSAEGGGESVPPAIPSHLLLRVVHVTPTFRLATINHDWLKQKLQNDPNAIRHHLLRSDEKADDVQIVLTADTAELQAFVQRHLKTEQAWEGAFDLKRDAEVRQNR